MKAAEVRARMVAFLDAEKKPYPGSPACYGRIIAAALVDGFDLGATDGFERGFTAGVDAAATWLREKEYTAEAEAMTGSVGRAALSEKS